MSSLPCIVRRCCPRPGKPGRRQHLHHEHDPQLGAWRRQALALIEERDRRAQVAVSRLSSEQVLAALQRRAGMRDDPPAFKALRDYPARLR